MICDPAWRLPGPSRFLDDIVDDLHEGASVIIGLAGRPPSGLRSNLAERIRELGLRRQLWPLSLVESDGPTTSPADLLTAEFGTRSDGAEEKTAKLLGANGLSPDVFWIEGLCRIPDDEPWRKFLRHFAQVVRAHPAYERPCLVLPVQGASKRFADIEDIGLRRRDWQGRVTLLDVALFAAEHIALRPHPAAIAARDFVAQLIAELSEGDLELAETLVTLPVDQLLEPLPALAHLGETLWGLVPGRCADHGPAAGVPTLVSAALRGDTHPVKRALWRAQSRILFPMIEERRSRLVEDRPAWLKPPYPLRNGETIVDPLDLELIHLLHLVRRTSPSHPLVKELGTLTRIRNDLAHLRPCPAPLLAGPEIRPLLDLAALR